MLHDPPVPEDGSCALCGGPRRTPATYTGKPYATAEQYASEPFCSTECCREWHGVLLPASPWSPMGGKKAAA
jgi:hypothetical protein